MKKNETNDQIKKKKKGYDQIHSGPMNPLVTMTEEEFDASVEDHYSTSNEKIRLHSSKGYDCSRELFTYPWGDSACFGVLYKLLEYRGYRGYITQFQFGCLILWKKRTIQNQFKIIEESELWQHIEVLSTKGGSNKRAYRLLDTWTSDYEGMKNLLISTHYRHKFGMNKPETYIFINVLQRILPHEWRYTGARKIENRIGNMYPDFTHNTKKLVIEFNGPFHHDVGQIKENSTKAHDNKRRQDYIAEGHKALILRIEDLAQTPVAMKKLDMKILKFNNSI